jgi:hypothetical protein
MILCSYVEQCKNVIILGGGGERFHNVCDDGQPNGSLSHKKNLIKTFVLSDTSKLINNMIIISI